MKLSLTFSTPENAQAFLTKTGETDLANVHIGLINIALNSPGIDVCQAHGDPIEFLVLQQDGSWATELVADPVARVRAGEKLEPAAGKIKMLLGETWDYNSGTWGQIRVSNRYPPMIWPLQNASITPMRRVEIILIDSGINTNHQEFVSATIENLYKLNTFADYGDDLHHGTAIASLMVGNTLGLNPHAVVKNVKITSASYKPTLVELGQAFDAILSYHATCPEVPKIVNMSWSIPKSLFIESKLQQLANAGLMLISAAGNVAMDASEITPASFISDNAILVAASNKNDEELVAVYSSDKKINLYAPGEQITHASHLTASGYATSSGSSLSAGFVSAVASLHFALTSNMPLAFHVKQAMSRNATPLALTLNENVTLDENKLLCRLDCSSTVNTNNQYLGNMTLATLVAEPYTLHTGRLLPLPAISETDQPVYTINYTDTASQNLISGTHVDSNSILRVITAPDASLPSGTPVQVVSFSITMTLPGYSLTSPLLHLLVIQPDVNPETDLGPYLEELGDYNNVDFRLSVKFGYYNESPDF